MKEGTKTTLDTLDASIVAELQLDGRVGNRTLAEKLKVTETTIASRLRRLEQQSVVKVVAITDMRKFQFSELAFVLLQVGTRYASQAAQVLAKMPESLAVTITTGPFNLIVATLANDRRHLAELMNSRINQVSGVEYVNVQLSVDVHKYASTWASLSAEHPLLPAMEPCASADELDIEIIKQLQIDARTSNRKIAQDLGISEGTVRQRLKRLLSEKIIKIQAISDVLAFGMHAHAYIGIKSDGGLIANLVKRLSKESSIVVLTRTLGSFDLFAVVATLGHHELIDLVVNRISQMPGVRRVETFESYSTTKHCYTWGALN